MALYEHVFIARQDLSSSQAEELITKYSDVIKDNGGTPSEGHVLTVDSSGEAAFAVGGVTQSVAIALSVAVG